MSKAIQGAVSLAGAVAIGVTEFALASTGVGLAALPALTKAMTALAIQGVSMEVGAIGDALSSNRSMGITTRTPAAYRQIIYGERQVGGQIIFRSSTGSSKSNYNTVIILAGHTCDSIVNMYLDGRLVWWNPSSVGHSVRNGVSFGGSPDGANHTGPDGQTYNLNGNVCYCEPRFGDQLPGDVISGLTANDPTWATTADGSPYVGGCTYVYLKLERNDSFFINGFPEIKFTVRGKNNIWDPRTQTRGYTTNAALIAADIITDPAFGLGDSSVNQDQLVAAANICDEQVAVAALNGLTESRYTAHYVYDTSVTPGSALETIMQSMGGRLSRIGGEWYIFPAAWQGPTYSFNEGHLTDTITWESYRSYSELVNRVTGTYVAPNYPYAVAGDFYDDNGRDFAGRTQNNFSFGWMPTSFPNYSRDVLHGYSSSIDQDADGGQVLPQDITLPAVTSVTQAQRLAKIALMRNRQQGSGAFPMSLAGWQTQPCDVMQFSFAENGWINKNLEVVGVTFAVSDADQSGVQSVECQMTVQETDPSVYEWDPTTEELTVYCKRAAA